MAHVFETRTTMDDFLKYDVAPSIVQATKEQSIVSSRLKTITKTVPYGGKSLQIPILYNSMGGVASLDGEADVLPASLPGNYDLATVPIDYHYFGMSVTNPLIKTSTRPDWAAAQAWANEIAIKTRAFNQHMNRQFCLDGNGRLCQVDGAVSGQDITVDNAGGLSGFQASNVNGDMFLSVNQYVQARDSSGTVSDAGLKITAITPGAWPSTSAILTVSGTCSSVADGDYLYAAASATASNDSYGHESPGLKLLIDDGTVASTVQSIDCSSYPEWRSHVGYGSTPGTAEALSTLRMMTLMSQIMAGGGEVGSVFTSPSVWLTYGNLADQGNQIMNAKVYDTGWPTLNFLGTQIFSDPYLADEMHFVDHSALAIYQPTEPGWVTDMNGNITSLVTASGGGKYDALEAYWYWYATLGVENRKKCGKLVDIAVNNYWKL